METNFLSYMTPALGKTSLPGGSEVSVFCSPDVGATSPNPNIDWSVVDSFGEEWERFQEFSPTEIQEIGEQYFDVVPKGFLRKESKCLDVGCGTGRWATFLAPLVGTLEAIDPSRAALVAARNLDKYTNVRVTQASIETLPFADDSFDFVYSLGVLHHTPDPERSLAAISKKVKRGGGILIYLYYALDGRPLWFKAIFSIVNLMRLAISKMPNFLKRFICDFLAASIYLPLATLARVAEKLGVPKRVVEKIPLSYYRDRSLYIMRNDSLDRFGTSLEIRFSKNQIVDMLKRNGFRSIQVSDSAPYWHAFATKK